MATGSGAALAAALAERREARAQAEEEASFPVPTADNPSAVFVDPEQAARGGDGGGDAAARRRGEPSEPLGRRKRKLLELRKRQAAGRADNQLRLVEEHRAQQHKPASAAREGARAAWEAEREERERRVAELGAGAGKMYLLETAERAGAKAARSKEKAANVAAARESDSSNQETLLRAHANKVRKLERIKRAEGAGDAAAAASAAPVNDVLAYGGRGDDVTEQDKERLVKAIEGEERRVRVRARLAEEDVSGINAGNERYNQVLAKKLDKYTVELRQNLERGTAL